MEKIIILIHLWNNLKQKINNMEETLMYIYQLNAIIVFVFLSLICVLFKEGAERLSDKLLNAYITGNQSELTHKMGWFLRLGLLFILGLSSHHLSLLMYWMLIGLFILIAWPGFNITINIFRKSKWYYVGKNGIDGLIRKVFFFVNFDKK